MAKPNRIIFFGGRRIAQQCVKLFMHPCFRAAFDVRVMVADKDFYDGYCKWHGGAVPQFISNETRQNEVIETAMREQGVDTLISLHHNWILPASLLRAVGGRAFNLHNGKLPEYRGYNCIGQSIWNNEPAFITTLHWMVEQVDMGPIAYEGITPLSANDNALSVYQRAIRTSAATFVHLLQDLAKGHTPPQRPVEGRGHFYSRSSLKPLEEKPDVEDAGTASRRARALFFPPFQPAWVLENPLYKNALKLPDGSVPHDWLYANRTRWDEAAFEPDDLLQTERVK